MQLTTNLTMKTRPTVQQTRHALKAACFAAVTLCLTLCLLCLGSAAHAQLRIDFIQPTLVASPGSTLTFAGLLTNLGTEDVLLAGDTFSLTGDGLTLDDSSFLLSFPETLAAGTSASGDFFTVTLGSNPPLVPGVYSGTFAVFGEGVTTGGGYESTSGFNVVAAPEPASVGLLITGMLLCGGTALRRQGTRRRLSVS